MSLSDRRRQEIYRILNARVARAVAAYDRAEVLVCLRAIAYLSHSYRQLGR